MVECGDRGGGIWRRLACLSTIGRSWRLGQPPGCLRRWMDQRTRLRWRRWVDQRLRGWWRCLGQSPVLWRWGCLGQSLVNDPSNHSSSPLEPDRPVKFLPGHLAEELGGGAFVAIVRTQDERGARERPRKVKRTFSLMNIWFFFASFSVFRGPEYGNRECLRNTRKDAKST
jgi:hypothetical protein